MLLQTQTQDDEYRLFTDSTISYMGDSLVEEKFKKNLMVEPTISEAYTFDGNYTLIWIISCCSVLHYTMLLF